MFYHCRFRNRKMGRSANQNFVFTPHKRRGPISAEFQSPGPAAFNIPGTIGSKYSREVIISYQSPFWFCVWFGFCIQIWWLKYSKIVSKAKISVRFQDKYKWQINYGHLSDDIWHTGAVDTGHCHGVLVQDWWPSLSYGEGDSLTTPHHHNKKIKIDISDWFLRSLLINVIGCLWVGFMLLLEMFDDEL